MLKTMRSQVGDGLSTALKACLMQYQSVLAQYVPTGGALAAPLGGQARSCS